MARASQQKNLLIDNFNPFDVVKKSLVAAKPWDSIEEFATSKKYCGLKLYPRQLTLLKLIFLETENMSAYDLDVINEWTEGFKDPTEVVGVQPDVWERIEYLRERGYRRFPHIQMVMGRRASKGVIGGIVGAEQIAYMYSLDNWQEYYGLPDGKEAYLYTLATSLTQAKRFQFADIRQTVERCAYLQPAISTSREEGLTIRTPSDLRTIAKMQQDGVPIEREIASLRIIPMSSNSASGRGAAAFGIIYDEFAFTISGTGSNQTGESLFSANQPALDQFGKDSLTMIPSSPWSKSGKFYGLYKEGTVLLDEYNKKNGLKTQEISDDDKHLLEEEGKDVEIADPEMLIIQVPSWNLYLDYEFSEALGGPKFDRAIQYPPDGDKPENLRMARLRDKNPETFKVERGAQFQDVIDSYLNPIKVDEMFEPFWDGRVLEEQSRGMLNRQYRIHIDPATTTANFGLAIGHLEVPEKADEHGDKWPVVIMDFLHVWKPEDFPDHTIDYTVVYRELVQIIKRFPTTTKFTSDAWNSAAFLAMLREEFGNKMLVTEANFSDKGNRERAEKFKSALNLGWVKAYKDDLYDGNEGSLLELESKFLTEKNGKVQKQSTGPVTTKDLFDTVSEVTVDLLSEQLDHWERKLLGSSPAYGSTDIPGVRSGRVNSNLAGFSRPLSSFQGRTGNTGLGRNSRSSDRNVFSSSRGRRR